MDWLVPQLQARYHAVVPCRDGAYLNDARYPVHELRLSVRDQRLLLLLVLPEWQTELRQYELCAPDCAQQLLDTIVALMAEAGYGT